MSIETLDYTIVFNEHTVTCFEVGSMPTIGYASIEDAMTGTNPVIVPECIFEAVCALLDQGVHLTAIYAHVGEETWMQWDEVPEELTAEDIVAIEGENSIRKQTVNRKQRRSARRVQNKRHHYSDRKHGKKRMPSAKVIREADKRGVYHAHAKFVWHENHKEEWIPRTVKKHEKFRQERFVPSPDWDGEPDPLMPAERLERNQLIEKLKNQLDVLDWEMEDVTDRIRWCREDIEEIEWHKKREVEVRQYLKEWQDRLDTLTRQYNNLTERIADLSV